MAEATTIRDRVNARIRSRSALPTGVFDIEFASASQWTGSELVIEFANEPTEPRWRARLTDANADAVLLRTLGVPKAVRSDGAWMHRVE